MSKIQLDESGKVLDLRSYKGSRETLISDAHKKMVAGDVSMHTFRKTVIGAAYPEYTVEELDEWPSSDLSQLSGLVLRYANGGPDAVKNSLLSGDGIQTSPAQPTAGAV